MTEEQMSTLLWLASLSNLTPEEMAERDRLIAQIEAFREKVNGRSHERYREADRYYHDPE